LAHRNLSTREKNLLTEYIEELGVNHE